MRFVQEPSSKNSRLPLAMDSVMPCAMVARSASRPRMRSGMEGLPKCRSRRDQLHDAALLFIPREFGQQRDVWQECFSLGARLSEKGDVLLLEPVGVLSGDRSKAESAALDLAALHAEIDILGSPIADHDLEPGPEQVVHDSGDDDNPRSCAGTAKDDLLFPRLLD